MNLIYKKLLRPLLFRLDAEHAHNLACRYLSISERSSFIRYLIKFLVSSRPSSVNLMGLSFPNQLGLAAGMDKNAQYPNSFTALGFGHIEVGTVTPKAQPGNSLPRLFRYPKYHAIVNRMGFNNLGVNKVSENIESHFPKHLRPVPLGVNIGKGKDTPVDNAIDDYIYCFKRIFKIADYVTVNISSPNTPNLRELHKSSLIVPLLKNLVLANLELAKKTNQPPVPLLLKISPDESYKSLEMIVTNAIDLGFSGVIATNTTINRNENKSFGTFEMGGLSGKPIETRSLEIIRFLSKLSDRTFPIIGVGGIFCRDSALRKLDAGASLIQIYSSFIYNGPLFPSTLSRSISYRSRGWLQ